MNDCEKCKYCDWEEYINHTGEHCAIYPWKCIENSLREEIESDDSK